MFIYILKRIFLLSLTLACVAFRQGTRLPEFLMVAGTTFITTLPTCIVLTYALQFLQDKK